jgi:hypothetical protein
MGPKNGKGRWRETEVGREMRREDGKAKQEGRGSRVLNSKSKWNLPICCIFGLCKDNKNKLNFHSKSLKY